ncbi:glycosyltransferase [Candidatus Methylospira mobilis]|uniref:Glycosyltransferase n=1 Tax=Candidatus Methylospira mobilis TaxID=1808979 RepID=A0A5Q0BIM8_9GAMM|nr:glycosyltransferase [Candidatus Methylospira mobilis]QFY42061.1 glycosyltransferase [Candidatus Methylospira mobilis]WNV03068.1 glycosyltransferase [Candidatus Methylospira mobilis]
MGNQITPTGKRILIISVSAGAGHIKAAEALEKSFRADHRVTEVINLDALQYTNKLFRDFYSRFYDSLVKSAPNFLGWWYKTSDEPWSTDTMRHMLDRLNTKPLVRFIRSYQPHITVCTHFMPAGIISHLITNKQLEAHLSIVVTDYDFHAMWLSRAFHRYFVASDETQAYLQMLGLPEERITVSGIPIDPVFSQRTDLRQAKLELGLNSELPVLLLSAGALGASQTDFLVERLRCLNREAQTLVVCGRNAELKQQIEQRVGHDPDHFRIMGYTQEMHRLMQAADLFIGKPGGLTVSEALASELPICIVNPIPGQEERNSDHLLEQGVAIKCNEPCTLSWKIERLLDNPERLAQMRHNARRIAKPHAALTVVDTLIEDRLPPLALSRQQRNQMLNITGADLGD